MINEQYHFANKCGGFIPCSILMVEDPFVVDPIVFNHYEEIPLLNPPEELGTNPFVDIKNKIMTMSPNMFEKFVEKVFSLLGYTTIPTSLTRDGGKDVVLLGNEVPYIPYKAYVECKHWSESKHVNVNVIRNMISVCELDKVNQGIIVTSTTFTKDAKKLIQDYNLDHWIILLDVYQLSEIICNLEAKKPNCITDIFIQFGLITTT